MNAFARIDKAAFYDFVRHRRDGRYEYVRGRIVQQLTGGTRDHGLVAKRIEGILDRQLDAKAWNVLRDRGVETDVTIRYPDVSVEPSDEPGDSLSTKRPRLVVEVLSPSTAATDLDVKPAEYLSLATLDAYIIASQTEAAMLVWARGADGSFPADAVEVSGRGRVLTVESCGVDVAIPLDEVYRGID